MSFSDVSAQELEGVDGGVNLFVGSGRKGDYGVAFFDTGIAWVNPDGSYGFLPSNGGKPITGKA